MACLRALALLTLATSAAAASDALLSLKFDQESQSLTLHHGARRVQSKGAWALEFTSPLQYAELRKTPPFEGIKSITVGGWFFPRRSGEQYFFFRGMPEVGPQGERFFRRQESWINFVLGTDQHGFLLGTVNGNGNMPFPLVTVDEVGIDAWHQLVVTKSERGHHSFYRNGELVFSDTNAIASGKAWPFRDGTNGEPIRLAMPLGGLVGEAWISSRELSATDIRQDFERKKKIYHPALAPVPCVLREMNQHASAGLWKPPVIKKNWPGHRKRISKAISEVLGPFPKDKVPLEPQIISEHDAGRFLRRKISIQVQAGDWMTAWLLVPKTAKPKMPAIICFYGTTGGAGKDTTAGLSGRAPGSAPHPNLSFAVDMAEAGFVALAPDYLRDGERIKPGRKPYDTTDFYEQFPDWSIHGKDIWDTSRAIDYLQGLNFVDAKKIGMVGHSYGGHSTIFTAALEPRIKVAVANGPVSDFLHHGLHWAVPKGGGNSQSLPNLRPYVLDHTLPLPVTFCEWTALIAPRPLLVGQAVGERRPMEEENYAAVKSAYDAIGHSSRVRYHWYAGDHDFPPEARRAAVQWFKRWFDKTSD